MTGRRVCSSCGASYHIEFNPSKIENKCDICGSTLVQRKDDTEETVKERLDVYDRQTQPLIQYYKEQNILEPVNGTEEIDTVFKKVCDVLGAIK